MKLTRPCWKFVIALAAVLSVTGSTVWADAAKEKELIAVLQSDAPAAEKAITCKRLAVYGSGACVAGRGPGSFGACAGDVA